MKRFMAGLFAGITVLALTTGCTKWQLGPKMEIALAAQDFAAAGKAGITLRAGGNVEDLIALAKKEEGPAFTKNEADLFRNIYRSSFTMAWERTGYGPADDNSLVKTVVGGFGEAEMRVVAGVTYVRVPIAQVAAKLGGTKQDLDSIRQMLGAKTAGVDALIDGDWVWISAADMLKFAQSTGAPTQADPNQNKYDAQLIKSAQNLIESAKVVYDKKDRTHLILTTSTVQAFQEGKRLLGAMKKLADKPTAQLLDETLGADLKTPPANHPIVLDLWIANGKFKALEINLLQFVKGSTGRAGLRIEFFRGMHIAAPGHATKLDLNKIIKALPKGGPESLLVDGVRARRGKVWSKLVRG